LLHGFPEISYGWRHQLGALGAAGLHVVAPDQRGYGWSSKPSGRAAYAMNHLADDIVALARAFGHERVRIVGHDWGGLVSWSLLERRSGFVERAAILNAPHPATMMREVLLNPMQAIKSSYIGLFQLPWLPETLLSMNDYRLLQAVLTGSSRADTFSDDELQVYRQAWSMDGALSAMLNWYRAITLSPAAQRGAEAIDTPVRIIWGDRDSALSARLADRAAALCRNAEVFHLDDASHWLHHEQPERVNRLLIDFLI
jgi:pimeloyl-ACP methyl ester carboxylesterase